MRSGKAVNTGTTLAEALDLLSRVGWFSKRSDRVRAVLGDIARLRFFAAGAPLYLVGDEPNGVFGLVDGSLDVSIPRADGTDFTFHLAEPGFWVGDLAIMTSATRLVSVRAATDATVVQFGAADLARVVRDQPSILHDFYALTYANFATTFFLLANVSITSSESRVALRLLLQLERAPDPEGWVRVSQGKLGELVALSQPTLQRALRRLQEMGCIEQGYGQIRVIDRARLLDACGESADLKLFTGD